MKSLDTIDLEDREEVLAWIAAKTAVTVEKLNAEGHDLKIVMDRLTNDYTLNSLRSLYADTAGKVNPGDRADAVERLAQILFSSYVTVHDLGNAQYAIDPTDTSDEAETARLMMDNPLAFCTVCGWSAWSPAEAEGDCDCPPVIDVPGSQPLPHGRDIPDMATDPDGWARTWGGRCGQTFEVDAGDGIPQLWDGLTWQQHERAVAQSGIGKSAKVLAVRYTP
ncbi:hypothetical protein [Streptomyces nanshensis]|uniref:Uncharacterized protein n=1 Tax=Streptomyces nanshensis TaxID=518642 RepID=A0A1E7L8C9_9ACTN|nr:hypothetical protein [Streptomyces nanshensis]OEV12467.1 hypothetical protein AN218_08105 [Streptomyces nanshensis]